MRLGAKGLMETVRVHRPDSTSLKTFYGKMFYKVSDAVAQCMFPCCFTTHSIPNGSFSNPMKHLRKCHEFVLAENDVKAIIETEADTQSETQQTPPRSSRSPFQMCAANQKKLSEAKLECAQNLAELVSHGPVSLSFSENPAVLDALGKPPFNIPRNMIPGRAMLTTQVDKLNARENFRPGKTP